MPAIRAWPYLWGTQLIPLRSSRTSRTSLWWETSAEWLSPVGTDPEVLCMLMWRVVTRACKYLKTLKQKNNINQNPSSYPPTLLCAWLYVLCESLSVVSDSLRPHGMYSSWNSPGQNTGVDSLSLLQGIFPTQGSNPGLRHCRQILYQLSF